MPQGDVQQELRGHGGSRSEHGGVLHGPEASPRPHLHARVSGVWFTVLAIAVGAVVVIVASPSTSPRLPRVQPSPRLSDILKTFPSWGAPCSSPSLSENGIAASIARAPFGEEGFGPARWGLGVIGGGGGGGVVGVVDVLTFAAVSPVVAKRAQSTGRGGGGNK